MMQAHRLTDGASFGPETLKIIGQAFDEAWITIAGNFSAATTEAARLKLANTLLSVATKDSREVEAVKRAALEAMALSYRRVAPNRKSK